MEAETLFTPTLPMFLAVFGLIYLYGHLYVFRHWGPKLVAEASSCLISLAHGTPAVLMAINAVVSQHYPPSSTSSPLFTSPNTAAQNSVLDFSTAYFALDLIHYAVFAPKDAALFVCHHLATLYVFATCRYVVGHGAAVLLVLLALAEVTSLCQNVWTLAGLRKDEAPTALWLHEFLAPRFFGFYSVCRVLIGPVFVTKMWLFYASGAADRVVQMWAWVSWMVVITTAVLVSVLWVCCHWVEWFDQRSRASKKVS